MGKPQVPVVVLVPTPIDMPIPQPWVRVLSRVQVEVVCAGAGTRQRDALIYHTSVFMGERKTGIPALSTRDRAQA